MEKIASFLVNHLNLLPGIYVSRKDTKHGIIVTTFDLRITIPNKEPAMDSSAMHTMEHLGATFLRNSPAKDDVIYFGPMGCKTGFYLVMFDELSPHDVLELIKNTFAFICNFEGEIPGVSPRDCGNYTLQNLDVAKYYAKKYLNHLNEEFNYIYKD